MKKLVFTLLILTVGHFTSAQNFGIKVGLNFANAHLEDLGTVLTTTSLTGLQIGVIGDFNLSKSLYFGTGFLYSQKGLKMDYLGFEIKVPISYFEVPMNLVYKHDLGGTKLFVLGGAYIGYGLSAKVKSGDDEEEIEFGSNDDQLKRIDAGLNFGTGIEFQNIQLGINYELGIIDLENLEEATLKNRVFSISVAYLLGNQNN